MVRYVSPAAYQRLLRQQQDAVNKYNREVDRYNREVARNRQEVVRAINDHNRKVNAHNREVVRQQKQAVDNYNRAVRAHNAQVRANEQRRRAALNQLNTRTVSIHYTPLHSSAVALNDAYERLSRRMADEESDGDDDLVLGLPGCENANSLEIVDALLGPESGLATAPADLQQSKIENELRKISVDLDGRWRGALFSLDARNPDAARHFCTSAREIITTILNVRAPDGEVLSVIPDCLTTRDGKPTRRAKIDFMLRRQSHSSSELGDFIDADIDNVLELFKVFNGATHGPAGKYEMGKLQLIKNRVEGGILFLSRVSTTR